MRAQLSVLVTFTFDFFHLDINSKFGTLPFAEIFSACTKNVFKKSLEGLRVTAHMLFMLTEVEAKRSDERIEFKLRLLPS